MLQFSNTIQTLIDTGQAEVFVCFSVSEADNTLVRAATSHYIDVTLDNGITYVADDLIISVEPPKQNSTVDREKYNVSMNDPDYYFPALAEAGLVGKKVEVLLCFADNGTIYTQSVDRIIMYKGRAEGLSAMIDLTESGSIRMNLSGASPMMTLDMVKGIFFSKDHMRQRDSSDSCADTVYKGSAQVSAKWGRA